MDKRQRPATMRKRKSDSGMVTVSLKIGKKTLDELISITKDSRNHNMSQVIEETVTKIISKKRKIEYARKPHQSYPVKKTFTFTPEFVKLLKTNSNNMSAFADAVLIKAFQLK